MPAGFESYDPDGTLRISTATTSFLLLGELTIGGAGTAQDGNVVDARFSLGTPFFIVTQDNPVDREGSNAQFSFSFNQLNWHFNFADSSYLRRPYTSVLYGIRT